MKAVNSTSQPHPLPTQLIMRHPQAKKIIQSPIQTEKQQQKKKTAKGK